MSRFAVFVDAGYFFAAGAIAIRGTQVRRHNISIKSPTELARCLEEKAAAQCKNSNLLRIYWYDAMHGRPSLEQTTLARAPGIKVRLGTMNTAGEQKGVDSLVVTDLIELARNKAIIDAVVVSGDEDLRIAVQLAQSFGVRVHLLAVGDAAKNVSPSLQMEADSVDVLDGDWLGTHIDVKTESAVKPEALDQTANEPRDVFVDSSADPQSAAKEVADQLLRDASAGEISALIEHFAKDKNVPPEYDRKLIARTAAALGRKLQPDEMRQIRGTFVKVVRSWST